jgi:hypothetical protein
MSKIIRQGDVTLRPTLTHAVDWEAVIDPVLARGEATGTAHVVTGAPCEMVVVRDGALERRFLRVLAEGGVLTQTGPGAHHAPLAVPPGVYEVHQAREQDFFAGADRLTAD